jgi:S1-C subfamily serine protease
MMQRAIRFNHRNEWHFVPGSTHEYSDGFADLVLDDHGFPHERPRQRWSLSLSTKPIDERMQTRVTWVGAGSPAERMGFRVGDRLLQWDEIEVEYAGQVSDRLSSVAEGAIVTAVIERDGEQQTLRMAAPPLVD